MIHATEILSNFIADLKYENLPAEAIEQTKMYIADYYAACFAGNRVNSEFNEAVKSVFLDMGGKEESSVLFQKQKLPAANAAFINAVYAHGADMDDGNRKAMGHVAAHVMSAVFALAETLDGISGRDIFVAINAGYEVYNRVAAAAQPGLVHRGFHSTGTAGAIACGAVCAKLMGMDAEGIYNTMALSAIQASGLLIIAESGQACKPVNPANAAKTGILSAKMIAQGITSSRNPLESKKGWFHAMSDEIDESMITEGLGSIFTICESYLKPYPSCRHTHCGIEAAIKIREKLLKEGKRIDEVKNIKVNIYNNAIQIAGQIKVPQTPDDGKFSIHYSLATALCTGHYNLSDINVDKISDRVIETIEKIELVSDKTKENKNAGIRGAEVIVELKDGMEYSETVLIPKGDAANPFTWSNMEEKMNACMDGFYNNEQVKTIIENIKNMNTMNKFISIKEALV